MHPGSILVLRYGCYGNDISMFAYLNELERIKCRSRLFTKVTIHQLFSGDLRAERPNRLLSRPAHTHRDAEGLRRAQGEDTEGAEAVRRRL